jgi:hypothetical protein
LGGKHLMLADIGGDDRFVLGQLKSRSMTTGA